MGKRVDQNLYQYYDILVTCRKPHVLGVIATKTHTDYSRILMLARRLCQLELLTSFKGKYETKRIASLFLTTTKGRDYIKAFNELSELLDITSENVKRIGAV